MSRWSLSRKLILSTNSLVAIALLTVGLVISSQMSNKFKDTMENQLSLLAEVNAAVAAPLVWNLDTANLKVLVDRIVGKGSIEGLVFLNEKGEILIKDGAKFEDFAGKPFIEKEIKNEDKHIGTLRLFYNESLISDARKQALVMTFLFVVLGQFLVTGGVYWLARSLNSSISTIVNRLQNTSSETSTQSNALTAAAKTMSDAATSQASAIQETTATLEEMRALGETSSSHAKNSYGRASDSYEMTVSARGKMSEMRSYIEKMGKSSEETQEQMRKTNDNMADIVKTITEIKAKTNVINDIVFQTKLLSFNASVEAARAGEHGKGFAVVAEEVGQLASMSGNASKEISQLLDGSLTKVTQLASETKSRADLIAQQNKEQMALTEQTASELNIVFDQIVGNNEQVKVMMNELSTSINEYANGVKNIAEAMLSLDRVTQENADIASKVSLNSATMRQQSQDLNVVVKDLESEIFGENGHAQTVHDGAHSSSGKLLKFMGSKATRAEKPSAKNSPPKKQPITKPASKSATKKAVTPPKVAVVNKNPAPTTDQAPVVASPKSAPNIVPLTKSEINKGVSPVAIKKVSGDTTTHTKTTDGLSVPSRTDKRFEDL